MPLPATLNAFNQGQIDKARYGIQSQIYTFGPGSLPAGLTTVFSVQNWNTPDNSSDNTAKVCIITSLATSPQDPNVQISYTADSLQSDQSQGWTDGFPGGTLAYPTFVVAGENLQLVVNNRRGTPLASFQLNYGVTVMSLNLFQRLLLGFTQNDADAAALAALQAQESKKANPQNVNDEVDRLFAVGHRPFSLESVLLNLFENRRLSNPLAAIPFHMTISTGATSSTSKAIPVGNSGGTISQIYILRGISLESAATGGLNVVIDRDNDQALVNQLSGAAFVQSDDKPWPFFIPARDHFGVTISGSPGTYPVRLDIEAYNPGSLLLAHLNMGAITPKVQLGLQ